MATHADDTTITAPAGAATAEGNAPALADGGDHDRVVMLTLNADGTPKQDRPELIGDRDAALAATKHQFAEQAVSAVDTQLRGVSADAEGERDPDVLSQAHESARDSAHDRAEQTVQQLHQGLGD